jgi:hypothetical protein
MGNQRQDVRLTSRELFIFYNKKLGLGDKSIRVGGCSNKRILSKRTGIEWYELEKVFTRQGQCYFDNGEVVIMKLFTGDIEKGSQSMVRRGRGGMEKFVSKYVIKKDDY